MRRSALLVALGLVACARATPPTDVPSEPGEPSTRESEPERPSTGEREPSRARPCMSTASAEALDPCRVGAAREPRPPMSKGGAEALWARADLAYRQNLWAECAELFDELAEVHPEREKRAEASYAAILCVTDQEAARRGDEASGEASHRRTKREGHTRRLSEEEREREELEGLAPRPLGPFGTRMERAYARYLCLAPESVDAPRVEYRRARIHYEASRWDEAATLFRDLADSHPSDELASYAVTLYLDSLNVIARIDEHRREACHEQLAAEVERFLAVEALMRDEELRARLSQLRCHALRHRAVALSDEERFREAAELFVTIYSQHGEECSVFGDRDICEVLYNAAFNYEAQHCLEAAAEVRRRLVRDCGGEPRDGESLGPRLPSPWATRAILQLGDTELALGHHAEAARRYEDFARRFAGEQEAPAALHKATAIRLGLGQHDEALADARLFEKSYGRRRAFADQTASVAFLAGAAHAAKRAWADAARHYDRYLRRHSRTARPDELIRAHVELGMARLELGGPTRPEGVEALRRALELADGAPGEDRLTRYRAIVERDDVTGREPRDTAMARARLVLVVDAVARAREALGLESPERALTRRIGMSVERATDVLTVEVGHEGPASPLERCPLSLPSP